MLIRPDLTKIVITFAFVWVATLGVHADPAGALVVEPVVIGSAYDAAPFDGVANGKGTSQLIGNINGSKQHVLLEFDISAVPMGTVTAASFIGAIFPNNAFDTGTRTHEFFVYPGNGSIDIADYNAPGTSVGSISHPSGGFSSLDLDIASAFQAVLDNGSDYLGIRIEPGNNPQGWDALTTTGAGELQIEFNVQPAGSDSVSIQPTFDVLFESISPGFFSMLEGGYSINTQKYDLAGVDRRGVLEFDLSSVPANADITHASLAFDLSSMTGGPGEGPRPRFYGYSGNGSADANDRLVTPNFLGEGVEVTALGPYETDIDPHYIESLLGASDFLGVMVLGSANNLQFGFDALEAFWSTPASLNLTYVIPIIGDVDGDGDTDADDIDGLAAQHGQTVPPTDKAYDLNGDGLVIASPNTVFSDMDVLVHDILGTEYGDTNLDGAVGLLDLDALGVHFGQAGGWTQGDLTGDGAVGLLDLDLLGVHFGHGISTPNTTPEPASLLCLAAGAMVCLRRRRA